MVSHRIQALFHVFSFTTLRTTRNQSVFRSCFNDISVLFLRVASLREPSRYWSCYTRGMFLDRAKLTEVLGVEVPSSVRGVWGVTYASRRVEDGFAFVAIPGFKRDGTEFAPEAVQHGASL